MIGSFAENVLPLTDSSVDDFVEPEQLDDNDVIADNDEYDAEGSDMTETDWNDALTDLDNITEDASTDASSIDEDVTNTDIADNEDDDDNDAYDYSNFKFHFASISMILLSIAF